MAEFDSDALHFIMKLEAHPETLFHAKKARQTEVIFRRASAAAGLHFGEVGGKDAGGFRNVLLSGGPLIKSLAKCLGKGVGKRHGFHESSVIIGDLDLVGMIVFPDENDPPLLIDPNAVKLAQVAGQLLKAVAGWNPQVVQFGSGMELVEFHFRTGLDFTWQFSGWRESENLPGRGIGEALDRAREITKKENRGKWKS